LILNHNLPFSASVSNQGMVLVNLLVHCNQ
jgi:hypothetical protein